MAPSVHSVVDICTYLLFMLTNCWRSGTRKIIRLNRLGSGFKCYYTCISHRIYTVYTYFNALAQRSRSWYTILLSWGSQSQPPAHGKHILLTIQSDCCNYYIWKRSIEYNFVSGFILQNITFVMYEIWINFCLNYKLDVYSFV